MKKAISLLALFPMLVFAEPLPKELTMPTDVGKVAITVNECPIKNKHNFEYEAYATELKDGQTVVHKGCWNKSGDVVYIWFYDEEPPVVAAYKDYHFKPETAL